MNRAARLLYSPFPLDSGRGIFNAGFLLIAASNFAYGRSLFDPLFQAERGHVYFLPHTSIFTRSLACALLRMIILCGAGDMCICSAGTRSKTTLK